jgi:hypothetical protein
MEVVMSGLLVVEALASDAHSVRHSVRYGRGLVGQFTDCRNRWQA